MEGIQSSVCKGDELNIFGGIHELVDYIHFALA